MLWIGLHLPQLSLEAFAATLAPDDAVRPLALLDGAQVASANAAAQAAGIRPGLKRATALALAPQLLIGTADARRDAQAIAAVAHALLAFTPMVSLEPGFDPHAGKPPVPGLEPHTVLAEVETVLGYWGGRGRPASEQRRRLLQQVLQAVAPLGHEVQMATAPTPLGAALLARRSRPGRDDAHALQASDPAALARILDASPVWLLGPGRAHWEALQGMGLRRLADLRSLPRSGLARRFGEDLLDDLDRAYGQRPDPREALRLPERFESRLELLHRADHTEQVMPGAQILLARLVAWLQGRHARARRFSLGLRHEVNRRPARDGSEVPPVTRLDIALAEPAADAPHLSGLLHERLARLPLPAPTLDLELHCHDIAHQPPPNGELFASAASEREGLARLIERLQARLGPQGVSHPVIRDDHRPERATALQAIGAMAEDLHRRTGPAGRSAVRPVWLLAEPRPLRDSPQGPVWQGRPLQLLSGPERLETGWWDADLVERDYFIAQADDGALVWIYRLRRPDLGDAAIATGSSGWFLQGQFG
jgi:protein ImuB